MKANYVNACTQRKRTQATTQTTNEKQKLLQEIENRFATFHGIIPREVVYAPFDRDLTREIILDHMANTFYPVNTDEFSSLEEFKMSMAQEVQSVIDQEVDTTYAQCGGSFFRSRNNQIYIFSNNYNTINDAKYAVKHESFHAGLYDLIRGRIDKLRIYKNKDYDSNFFANLITEHKMQTLVHNRNTIALQEYVNRTALFHTYSFEERFVIFNSSCSMLEEAISSSHFDINEVVSILKLYVIDSGLMLHNLKKQLPVNVCGKTVPLEKYLPTYLEILRGPIEQYDKVDQEFVACIEEYPSKQYNFEEIDSNIPELLDELLEKYVQGYSEQQLKNAITRFKKGLRVNPKNSETSPLSNN